MNAEEIASVLVNVQGTIAADSAMRNNNVNMDDFLVRHVNGDYGDVSMDTVLQNDLAMYQKQGECKSTYTLPDGTLLDVTTRWGQPLTTISLNGETG